MELTLECQDCEEEWGCEVDTEETPEEWTVDCPNCGAVNYACWEDNLNGLIAWTTGLESNSDYL